MANQEVLAEELEKTLVTRDSADWVEILVDAGVPTGAIYNYAQVFEDPQTLAREMVVTMEHPVEGKLKGIGLPVKLSDTPGSVRTAAPLLSADTDAVLAELGLAAGEISALRERGAI
jgi:crotonobetainyl-CoA:carnitine CoA-transferase CaiB-like acyl-CoA transferase